MPPKITPFSFDGAFSTGQYATVQCVVAEGDFPLQISWLFNNSPTSEAMGITISQVGRRNSILTIDSISAFNVGKYICKVENSAGMAAYATELSVNGIFFYLCLLYVYADYLIVIILLYPLLQSCTITLQDTHIHIT